MYIVKKEKDYLIKTTINLGEYFGAEKPEDIYITLKEPSGIDFIKLQDAFSNKDNQENQSYVMEKIIDLLPSVLVEHNIYFNEKTKMNNAEALNFLLEKVEVLKTIIETYTNDVLFLLIKKKKEEK